jgi:hypothetical protein
MPNEYITLIAAGIAGSVALVGVWWKNRHDKQMKLLDIQLKKADQNSSIKLSYNTRKAQAAEQLIKKFSFMLRRLKAHEIFFDAMVNRKDDDEFIESGLDQQFLAEMDRINEMESKEQIDVIALHYSFFAKDYPDEPLEEGDYADACHRIEQEGKIHKQLKKLNQELFAALSKHDEAKTEDEKQAAANLAAVKHDAMMAKAREYLEIIQLMIQFVEAGCSVMQSEMDGSKLK